MSDPAPRFMTLEAFLEWDDGTDRRYELIDGQPVAMAPPSEVHGTLVASIIGVLSTRLPDRCRVVAEGGVVPNRRGNSYFQTDVAVSCSPLLPGSRWTAEPVVLVEVLSPATREHDRGTKVPAYRDVASVQDIVLVSSDARRVEHWHRQNGGWHVCDLIGEADLRLDSIGVTLPLADIYRSIGL